MTFKNKFIGLSATALALVALIALGLVFSPENNQKRAAQVKLLSDGGKYDIGEFSITADKVTVRLYRDGTDWKMEKGGVTVPADSAKAVALIKALSGTKELYKVSSKKEDQAKFGFGAEGERHLSAKNVRGKVVTDIRVGGMAGTGNDVYLAFAGKDAVYSAKSDFASYLQTDDRSWANLKLITDRLKADEVQGISFDVKIPGTHPDASAAKTPAPAADSGLISLNYEIDRSNKTWKVKGDDLKKLDPSTVDAYVKDLLDFESDALVTDKVDEAKTLIANPVGKVTLVTGKGTAVTLIFSAPDAENRYVVKLSNKDQLYYTNHFTLTNRLRSVDSLTVVAAPAKAKAKAPANKAAK
jgi:hypothetical protein